MICLDNQPFSLVESTGFKRLLNTISPQYKPPSRKYFTDKIIPDIYNRVRIKISKVLGEASFISLTSDIWTCSNTNESFISITGHWISEKWDKRNVILCCDKFAGSHTGLAIADKLETLTNSWAIDKQKIHLLMRDSGANMVRGCKDAEINSEGCFIHKLQLIINDSLQSQRTVSDMISTARRIATHFNHSSLACSKLIEIQQEINMELKKIIQDVQTRWNSTFYMLERLLHLRRCVTIYLTENSSLNNLTNNQWDLLQSVLDLLRPFEEVTKLMSNTESIISEVIPTIAILKRYLLSPKIEQLYGVGTMKESLVTGINKRFSDVESKNYYTISTILDPRYKTNFFSSNSISDEIKKVLLEQIKDNCSTIDEAETREDERVTKVTTEGEDDDDEPLAAIRKRARINETDSSTNSTFTLWNCYNDFVTASTSASSLSGLKNDILHQLDTYYGMPIIDKKADPVEWWSRHREKFPDLINLVRQFLSSPATSVYSERLFSEIGNIYVDNRSRLNSENAEKLLFIHHNLDKINYEY